MPNNTEKLEKLEKKSKIFKNNRDIVANYLRSYKNLEWTKKNNATLEIIKENEQKFQNAQKKYETLLEEKIKGVVDPVKTTKMIAYYRKTQENSAIKRSFSNWKVARLQQKAVNQTNLDRAKQLSTLFLDNIVEDLITELLKYGIRLPSGIDSLQPIEKITLIISSLPFQKTITKLGVTFNQLNNFENSTNIKPNRLGVLKENRDLETYLNTKLAGLSASWQDVLNQLDQDINQEKNPIKLDDLYQKRELVKQKLHQIQNQLLETIRLHPIKKSLRNGEDFRFFATVIAQLLTLTIDTGLMISSAGASLPTKMLEKTIFETSFLIKNLIQNFGNILVDIAEQHTSSQHAAKLLDNLTAPNLVETFTNFDALEYKKQKTIANTLEIAISYHTNRRENILKKINSLEQFKTFKSLKEFQVFDELISLENIANDLEYQIQIKLEQWILRHQQNQKFNDLRVDQSLNSEQENNIIYNEFEKIFQTKTSIERHELLLNFIKNYKYLFDKKNNYFLNELFTQFENLKDKETKKNQELIKLNKKSSDSTISEDAKKEQQFRLKNQEKKSEKIKNLQTKIDQLTKDLQLVKQGQFTNLADNEKNNLAYTLATQNQLKNLAKKIKYNFLRNKNPLIKNIYQKTGLNTRQKFTQFRKTIKINLKKYLTLSLAKTKNWFQENKERIKINLKYTNQNMDAVQKTATEYGQKMLKEQQERSEKLTNKSLSLFEQQKLQKEIQNALKHQIPYHLFRSEIELILKILKQKNASECNIHKEVINLQDNKTDLNQRIEVLKDELGNLKNSQKLTFIAQIGKDRQTFSDPCSHYLTCSIEKKPNNQYELIIADPQLVHPDNKYRLNEVNQFSENLTKILNQKNIKISENIKNFSWMQQAHRIQPGDYYAKNLAGINTSILTLHEVLLRINPNTTLNEQSIKGIQQTLNKSIQLDSFIKIKPNTTIPKLPKVTQVKTQKAKKIQRI